mgnify:CR=1
MRVRAVESLIGWRVAAGGCKKYITFMNLKMAFFVLPAQSLKNVVNPLDKTLQIDYNVHS